MHEIEKQDPDIILVGGPSGILPEHHYHLQGIKMEQYEFLQGCNPDAVIVSINGNHDEEYTVILWLRIWIWRPCFRIF